jgi:hypothetical protein
LILVPSYVAKRHPVKQDSPQQMALPALEMDVQPRHVDQIKIKIKVRIKVKVETETEMEIEVKVEMEMEMEAKLRMDSSKTKIEGVTVVAALFNTAL